MPGSAKPCGNEPFPIHSPTARDEKTAEKTVLHAVLCGYSTSAVKKIVTRCNPPARFANHSLNMNSTPMKTLVQFITLALLSASWLQAQEINLFNGRDLTGWTVRSGGADFRVKDGGIVGQNRRQEKGMTHTFLTTKVEYDNFILSFEFKADRDVNSGVQFRSQFHNVETRAVTLTGKTIIRPPDRVYGYQFEIDTRDARNNAAIYDEGHRGVFLDDLGSNPAAQAAARMGDWNQARIECRGDSIKTFLNGVQAAAITDAMTPKGVIALQVHASNKPGAEVRWRNIRLLPLAANSTISAPAPTLATIQTDANQPRIEVVKDQGPNATEWALTPLEEAIPGDIRQNLTYLREDLLDESKKSPKADAAAYTLASDYCDKILTALDQRDLARVNAGFTAAQADAGVRVDSQALSARRNYQMSWPQYAREKDQRNEILRQQTTGADVKKERIKVEWATRAVQMRSYLDGLYTKLRAALR